jgi:hypothetical protein
LMLTKSQKKWRPKLKIGLHCVNSAIQILK